MNEEQQKANKLRFDQRVRFHVALSTNQRQLAKDLANEFDWNRDEVVDELMCWFESN